MVGASGASHDLFLHLGAACTVCSLCTYNLNISSVCILHINKKKKIRQAFQL